MSIPADVFQDTQNAEFASTPLSRASGYLSVNFMKAKIAVATRSKGRA